MPWGEREAVLPRGVDVPGKTDTSEESYYASFFAVLESVSGAMYAQKKEHPSLPHRLEGRFRSRGDGELTIGKRIRVFLSSRVTWIS